MSQTRCDLLVHSSGELCTMAGGEGPRRGAEQGDLGAISDGAAALVLASTEAVERLGLTPIARLTGGAWSADRAP